MYGAIKNLCSTALCNQHFTRIIRMNKTRKKISLYSMQTLNYMVTRVYFSSIDYTSSLYTSTISNNPAAKKWRDPV